MFSYLHLNPEITRPQQRLTPVDTATAMDPPSATPPSQNRTPAFNSFFLTLPIALLCLTACSQKKHSLPAEKGSLGTTALPRSYTVSPGIPYRQGSPAADAPHPQDAFEPDLYHAKGSTPQKVVVFIHGGGWMGGDKSNIQKSPGLIDFFVRRGYMVASLNFRLPERDNPLGASYKHQADDIAAAIRWLTQNVQNYGGSPDNFILLGYSSGAHLAALVSTDERFLARHGLGINRIKGTILLDAHSYDIPSCMAAMHRSSDVGSIPLISYLFGQTREEMLEASPASYTSFPGNVPFLIVSAGVKDGHDQDLSKDNSENFRKKLATDGHRASHEHFRTKSHTDLVMEFGAGKDPVSKSVANFLNGLDASI